MPSEPGQCGQHGSEHSLPLQYGEREKQNLIPTCKHSRERNCTYRYAVKCLNASGLFQLQVLHKHSSKYCTKARFIQWILVTAHELRETELRLQKTTQKCRILFCRQRAILFHIYFCNHFRSITNSNMDQSGTSPLPETCSWFPCSSTLPTQRAAAAEPWGWQHGRRRRERRRSAAAERGDGASPASPQPRQRFPSPMEEVWPHWKKAIGIRE